MTTLDTIQFAWGGLFDGEPSDGNVIHISAVDRKLENGSIGTLCGIDMFGKLAPGWSRRGGITHRNVSYIGCPGCLEVAARDYPGVIVEGLPEFARPINDILSRGENKEDLYTLCRAHVKRLLGIAQSATRGPWWFDEDDLMWRLHGVGAVLQAQPPFPEQIMNRQILKAPKKNTPYAEYWPSSFDAAYMIAWNPSITIPVCEGWLEQIHEHRPHPDNLATCFGCSRISDKSVSFPCWHLRSIACQLQIIEKNRPWVS